MRKAVIVVTLLIASLALSAQTIGERSLTKWTYTHITFKAALKTYNQAQDPKTTLTILSGNCMDFSKCLVALLKAYHESADAHVIICKVPWSKDAHAMVACDRDTVFLDGTNGTAYSALPANYAIIWEERI